MVATIVEFWIVVELAQHKPLCHERDRADDQWADHQRSQEADRRMAGDQRRNPPGKHRAQHEELTMRDVDHAHHAEHQRQAESRQSQHGGGDQALKGGEQEMGSEGHSGSATLG